MKHSYSHFHYYNRGEKVKDIGGVTKEKMCVYPKNTI